MCEINKWLNNELFELADFFKVFGDTTRLKILLILIDDELCVNHISERINISQSAVSHQLRVLRNNRLVKVRKNGKQSIYAIDDEHVSDIIKKGMDHLLHK